MSVLTVAPDLLSIRDIGPWLRECLGDHLPADELESFAMRCELALQEIAANIVNHGHAGIDPTTHDPIELDATVSDETLDIVIRDHGHPYEPADQPEPDPDTPQIHGYGLMIIRQLARTFEYDRVGDVNHTTLAFDLPH